MQSNYQLSYSKKQNLIYLISEFFFLIYEIFICLPLSIKFKYSLKRINKKRMFILGNGPSLQKDLRKIKKDSQIFAVNNFLSKNYYKSYKPNFLCCIDSMFWADFNKLSLSVKKSIEKTFIELNKVDWQIKIFIPKQAKKIFKSRINNKNVKLITIPSLSYDFECSYYLKILSYLNMPPPRINVVITAIYIGIISKVRSIQLLGIDMDRIYSFKVDQRTNKTYMDYIHFTKSKNSSIKFRDKFKGRKETNMYIKLKREASTFKWYAYISMLSKNNKILIRNKSFKSLVDSISR